ncbi:MAG: GIY-YIG nuclease family protein, partial [Candidatus Acidiferrales bacterium]
MFFVYVLRSRKTCRLYTGATSDLQTRLAQHNPDQSISTKHRGPWDLLYHEEFNTLGESMLRERFFKTGKGRDELKRILPDGSRRQAGWIEVAAATLRSRGSGLLAV